MMPQVSATDIRELFAERRLPFEEQAYLVYHAERYAYTVNRVLQHLQSISQPVILDIGPSLLTCCLRHYLPQAQIYSLGWESALVPEGTCAGHFDFDLNDCVDQAIDTGDVRFDLIVFSETIEHLYTSPAQVLPALVACLKTGAALLLQTPNATTIMARTRLLFGIHPYELIREERNNPGHFREYTMAELVNYAEAAGLVVRWREYCRYWPLPLGPLGFLCDLIPQFRRGLTLMLVHQA